MCVSVCVGVGVGGGCHCGLTNKRLDVLQDRLGCNVVSDLLVELHNQLGVSFTLFTQQVELLLLVAGDISHQLCIELCTQTP